MATENQDIEAKSAKVKIEITSEIHITAFVARQNANMFLLNHFGNLVSAGDPALQVSAGELCWKVPIRCAIPKTGMQTVGDLAVDVNTGEILLSASNQALWNQYSEYSKSRSAGYRNTISLRDSG
ncbi:MAG: hypothetical protein QGG64_07115 [Candidatus Latescibacteria bacterium]|nr:hypothetical protein [Candidatus Latescibacterota bacterium]